MKTQPDIFPQRHNLKKALIACLPLLLASVVTSRALDLDGDGMSDVWQRVHNIATGDTASDLDGDGQSNVKEAIAGTDPRDGNDHFRDLGFTLSPTLDSVSLSWRSVEERFYEIEQSADLDAWVVAGDATGQGGLFSTTTLGIGSPINDLYANRWPASTTGTQTAGSNTGATSETGEPINPGAAGGKTVWWSWSSDTSGPVTITTDGSDFDTTLAVYSGDGLSNLVLLGANDDSSGGLQSAVTFTAQAGVAYSVQVDGYSGSTGSIVLNHPVSSGVLPQPNIIPNHPPRMFFRVLGYPEYDQDDDWDTLLNWEERLLGTDPYGVDSDNDGMDDKFEFIYGFDPLSSADAALDADGDGLSNVMEAVMGGNPRMVDSDGNGISDADEDFDSDGLGNLAELQTYGTNPLRWDSDNDGLPDGLEIQHGLDPNDASGDNGTEGDADGDGLSNFDEWLYGTNPNSSDSDGDGINDNIEIDQGSDPNDSGDNGDPPPADEMVDVAFRVGDPSGSHSEKWKMMIRGLDPADGRIFSLTSPDFGEPKTKVFKLRKGNRYEVSVSHLATDPQYLQNNGNPDYDWEATVDAKPTTTSMESFDGIPGVNNYFVVKDHWIVDNRQAVFTTEKHGNDDDIVTGHTAILIPTPIERDKDVLDGTWETVAGEVAKALPGQKINLRFNQSRLPSQIVSSNLKWTLPAPVFKNFEANQQTGTLTEVQDDDLNESEVQFYFTNSGTKNVKLGVDINGEALEFDVPLVVLEPVANFTRVLDTVKLYNEPFSGKLRVGLAEDFVPDDIYHGIQWEGDVMLPAGWPQGKWHWVQTGTPNISVTDNNGNQLVYSTNGQTGLDTKYPTTPFGIGSHPGDAPGYPTGVPSNPGNTYGDSPSIELTNFRECSFAANFTTYMMFLPDGTESRYVPLKSMQWSMNVMASKNLETGVWSISSSGQEAGEPQTTTSHPTWDLNISGSLVEP